MRSHLVLAISFVCAAAVIGCSGEISFGGGEDGSGTAQTVPFQFGEVDRLSVGSTFRADVEFVDGPASAQVVVDDNLVDNLNVRVSDGVLYVEFGRNDVDPSVEPTALIKLPALTELRVSGASDVIVADEVVTSALTIDVSGASSVEVPMDVLTIAMEATGAADVRLLGRTDVITVAASGASTLDFAELRTGSADIDISGATTLELYEVDEIGGLLTGASTLETSSDASVDVKVSGASSVERE